MSAPQSLPGSEGHPLRKITMVKKLLANGEPCAKCAQAQQMLEARGVWDQIDEVVWAKEGDADSPGARIAAKHGVELAPFFVIEREGQADEVVVSTLKLLKALSSAPAAPAAASAPPLTPAEVAQLARELRDKSPQEILGWALARHGARCALAFSGAEDIALLDMAARSGHPYSVFCLDTGRLHEETYRFIDRVRAFYGVDIQIMFPEPLAVESLVRKKGLFSFREDGHGECCGVRKVEPLKRALAQFGAWATGQRRDQSPATRGEVAVVEIDGAFTGHDGPLLKLNPLTFWSSAQVWDYIRQNRVPYNELHDHGFVSIGCQPCTRPIRPGEHERAARWWWEESTQRECGLHVKKA